MNVSEFSVSTTFQYRQIAALPRYASVNDGVIFEFMPRRLSKDIAKEILDKYYEGISLADIKGDSRKSKFVKARWHIWSEVKRLRPDLSDSAIGRAFNRDHASIKYGIKKHRTGIGKIRRQRNEK